MIVRRAAPADTAEVARIYIQGIEDRIATFETRVRSEKDVVEWMAGGFPVAVALDDGGRVLAFASTGETGLRKLTSKVFVENAPSRSLVLKSLGFREIGTHERHGMLDGQWHDVVVVELLL